MPELSVAAGSSVGHLLAREGEGPRVMPSVDGFNFGIEHEFPVVGADGRFCDFTNTTFEQLDRVVEQMPLFESDYPQLRVGDLGIKYKRWYVEGFERFSEGGEYLRTDPKGYEIRTPICRSLDEAVATLSEDLGRWALVARTYGYRPVCASLNPFQRDYVTDPPLNAWEIVDRRSPEEQTAHMYMLTYGPDISLSHPDLTTAETIDIGKKLTFYSPYMVPFTFCSPFFAGKLWGGLSRRTYYRTGARPAALVFVEHENEVVPSFPTLVDKARLPAEVGRIEFKAFDCVCDVGMYRSLGALLLGVVLDRTLEGRALVPDAGIHQLSATMGFDDEGIRCRAGEVLEMAHRALPEELRIHLSPLESMLHARRTPAHRMAEVFRETGDVMTAIEGDRE